MSDMTQSTLSLKTDSDLSRFLLCAIRDVRENELSIDRATVISQLADKYTRNEMMRCVKAKLFCRADHIYIAEDVVM